MLETLKKAARAGGEELQKYFGTTLKKSTKTKPHDLVTEADHASERAILAIIEQELPDVNIQAEERGLTHKGSPYSVVVDPLDGTHNFYHGIPLFTTTLALLRGDELLASVTYHPILHELYYSEKNNGAYKSRRGMSDIRLVTPKFPLTIEDAVIAYAPNYHVPRLVHDAIQRRIHEWGVGRFMMNWSFAFDLCLLASGKIHAAIGHELNLHDVAAGWLICEESGARVTMLEKTPTTIIISHRSLHDELVDTIGSLLAHASKNTPH